MKLALRVGIWVIGIVLVLAVAVVLAFRFSPWPSVAIIQYAFSRGDQASEERLARHVPAGIVSRTDLHYGPGADEVFDLNAPDASGTPRPAVVWVHGGAFVAGSKQGVANYLKVVAGEGLVTVGVEYSTGFGTSYPRPVEQVSAALRYLVEHAAELGIDPTRIVLAGDSAGAQIASQVALIVTDPAYAGEIDIAPGITPDRLRGIVLVSGAFDLETIDTEGPYGWFVRSVLWAYTDARDFMNDPRVRLASIPSHLSAAFPPAFISSGNGDPLAPQAEALVARLAELSVPTETLFFPADLEPPLPHEYQFNLDTEQGQQAFTRMMAFIERVIAP